MIDSERWGPKLPAVGEFAIHTLKVRLELLNKDINDIQDRIETEERVTVRYREQLKETIAAREEIEAAIAKLET